MNPIDEQRQLIDRLYRLVRDSVDDEYDSVTCWFDYRPEEDGSFSIGSQLSFARNGVTNTSRGLTNSTLKVLEEVIPALHAKMKAHTGGDWQAFTLTINMDGSVTTKFEYPDQQA